MSIDCVNKVSHALAYVTASKNGVSEPEIEDFISLDDKVGENIRSDSKVLRTGWVKCILFPQEPISSIAEMENIHESKHIYRSTKKGGTINL